MAKYLVNLILFATSVFGSEGAAESAHHEFPLWPILFHLVNLILFIVIVYKFAGKSISSMFLNRSKNMEKDLKSAEAEMKEIDSEISKYSDLIASFESEQKKMRSEADKLKVQAQTDLKIALNEEELRLKEENKKLKFAEDLKQEKILRDSIVAQVLQMAKNELILKAKSKDVHFNLRQELQENLSNDSL